MKKLALVAVTLLALSGCSSESGSVIDLGKLRAGQVETDYGIVTCVYLVKGGVDCNWP